MNGCGHKIVRCSSCGRIVMQCRCPDPNKTTEYVVSCPKCPPTLVKEEDLPPTLRDHILPPVIQTKPAFGLPCNGCGLCCAEEVCGIGKMVHGEIDGPCPSLVLIGELYRCGLVMAEAIGNLPPLISDALAIGKGCDSEDLN